MLTPKLQLLVSTVARLLRRRAESSLAKRCRTIFEAGRRYCAENLFNGEYYVQLVDLQKHPKHQHADGCLSDQLFGQGWAHQVALGYILPPRDVK